MKVAVATQNGGLEDNVSPIVGRAPTFTLAETENGEIDNVQVIQNEYAQSASGAGIQAAQMLVQQGIQCIIGGNFGPNLVRVLTQAGIQMYQASGISVKAAVQQFINGQLNPIQGATGPAHTGMGMGRTGGMGMGRGMATGRGMGMAGSGAQPNPYGQGQQQSGTNPQPAASSSSTPQSTPQQELQMLKEQAKNLEAQLEQIRARIDELQGD